MHMTHFYDTFLSEVYFSEFLVSSDFGLIFGLEIWIGKWGLCDDSETKWPVCMRVFMPLSEASPLLQQVGFQNVLVDTSGTELIGVKKFLMMFLSSLFLV
jgi:hypothetical protein